MSLPVQRFGSEGDSTLDTAAAPRAALLGGMELPIGTPRFRYRSIGAVSLAHGKSLATRSANDRTNFVTCAMARRLPITMATMAKTTNRLIA